MVLKQIDAKAVIQVYTQLPHELCGGDCLSPPGRWDVGAHPCTGMFTAPVKSCSDLGNVLKHRPAGSVWAGKLAVISLHIHALLADTSCSRYTPYICISSNLPAAESANPLGSV